MTERACSCVHERDRVYVVVVNWNGLSHLRAGLPSLAESLQGEARVVVVDNNSTDGSKEFVAENYPQFTLLKNPRNLGFAEANNVGIEYAMAQGAEYVALLNNDTRVEADWLEQLLAAAEGDDGIALCEATQYTWDGQQRIALRLRLDWLEGVMTHEQPDRGRQPVPTGYAAGCCLLARCSALRRIGLFDPAYFAYVEDVDLSLRAWIAGFKVVRVPGAIVYHRVGGTTQPLQQMRFGYRNQLTTMLKDYEVSTLRDFAGPIAQRWLLTRNRYALQGTLDVLGGLPATLRARRRVQQTRVRSDREIFRLAGLQG